MLIEKKHYKLFGSLGLLVVLAVCSFIYQVIQGLGVTGLSEPVVWGLYLVNFTFCLGLGAGILIFLTYIIRKQAVPASYKFLVSFAALLSLALSGLFILIDLGRIDRFYYMVIYAQPKSPLFWDFVVLNTLMAVSFGFCFVFLREIFSKRGLPEKANFIERFLYRLVAIKSNIKVKPFLLKVFSWFVCCLVVGLYLLTTEIFVGLKAHPQWNSPFVSFIFLISALLSGLSLLIILGSFDSKAQSVEVKSTLFDSAKRFLVILLTIDLLVNFVKYGLDRYNPLIQDARTLFPFSLFIFLLIGNILPLLLARIYRENEDVIYRLVPLLVLVGVVLKRAELIISAYFRRWLPFAPGVSYVPTIPEILIVLGIFSGAVVVFIFAFQYIKRITQSYER